MYPAAGGLQPVGVQAIIQNLQGFLSGLGQMNSAMAMTGNASSAMASAMNAAGRMTAQQISNYMGLANASLRVAASENSLGLVANRVADARAKEELALQRYQLATLKLAQQMGAITKDELDAAQATYKLNAAQTAATAAANKVTAAEVQAQNAQMRHAATLNSATVASARYSESMNKVESATRKVVQVVATSVAGFSELGNIVMMVGGKVLGFFSNIASTALGFLTRDVIGGIARQIRDMGEAAVEAAADIQTLTIRLDNMIARQIRAADETINLENSLSMARGATSALVEWMKQLAAATPFGPSEISDTASFAIAMGWGVNQAKTLTEAILDFTAGMGLGNAEMTRIIYNFAQMKAAGKVTGTEMRDLARGAFFPLTEVLDVAAKKLGIGAEGLQEFRKAAADGTIDIETFFESFIEVVKTDFPDAAKKMNITFAALKDNVKGFFQVFLGWDMLGPTVARFSEIASKALQRLLAPEVEQEFVLLGKAILDAFNSIIAAAGKVGDAIGKVLAAFGIKIPTVEEFVRRITYAVTTISVVVEKLGNLLSGFINTYVVPFAQGIGEKMGGSLEDVASKAFTWGANIVINLAEGIIRAAAAALAAAMSFVSKIFSRWLAPGSPPKILPDIGKWGAAAMAEFLHGFSMADFAILDSVQSALKGALDSLVGLGQMKDKEGTSLFKSLSQDLIAAIGEMNRTGDISGAIFDKLRKLGGGFGKELADLLEKEVALGKATEKVAIAERELKAAQDATKTATARVNSQVKEYNQLLREGADKRTLKAKLAQVNASERDLDAARKRQKAAEIATDEAKKALDPLKEAAALQEKLLQQLIELAKAEKEAREAGGGGGGGEVPTPELPPIGGVGDVEKKLNDLFDRIKKSIEDKLGGIWDALKARWDKAIGPLIADILAKWNTLITTLRGWWDNFVSTYWTPIWLRIQAIVDITWQAIEGIIDHQLKLIKESVEEWGKFLEGWWERHGENVTKLVRGAWNLILLIVSSTIVLILDEILRFIKRLEDFWGRHGKELTRLWDLAWKAIQLNLMMILEILGNLIDAFVNLTEGNWKGFVDNMRLAWDNALQLIGNSWRTHNEILRGLMWVFIDEARSKWQAGWEAVRSNFNNVWDSLTGKVQTVIDAIRGKISQFYGIGQDIIRGIINGAASLISSLISTITGAVQGAIDAARRIIRGRSPSLVFKEIGANMMQGMALGIQESMRLPQFAVTQATATTVVQAQQVAAPSVLRQSSVQFGDVNINNGMELGLFEQRVRQIVREEL